MSLKQRKIELITKDKIEPQHVLRVIGFFLLLSYCAINGTFGNQNHISHN